MLEIIDVRHLNSTVRIKYVHKAGQLSRLACFFNALMSGSCNLIRFIERRKGMEDFGSDRLFALAQKKSGRNSSPEALLKL